MWLHLSSANVSYVITWLAYVALLIQIFFDMLFRYMDFHMAERQSFILGHNFNEEIKLYFKLEIIHSFP